MKRQLFIAAVFGIVSTSSAFAAFLCPDSEKSIEQETTLLSQIAIQYQMPEAYSAAAEALPIQHCYVAHMKILHDRISEISGSRAKEKLMRGFVETALHAHLVMAPLGEYDTSAWGKRTLIKMSDTNLPLISREELLRLTGHSSDEPEFAGDIELSKFLAIRLPIKLVGKPDDGKVGHFSDRLKMEDFVEGADALASSSEFHLGEMRDSPLYQEFKLIHNSHVEDLNGAKVVYDGIWPDHMFVDIKSSILEE